MARKKKPENETAEAQYLRRVFEHISNIATRSEKTSWNRKLENMIKLTTQLAPIEDKILDIILKEKQPIVDQVNDLRHSMVNECVHPYDYLLFQEKHVLCKFCNRKLSITNVK